jgi:hypothetical protein
MYIKLTNGIPEKYSIGQLRRDNSNTSFPKNPSDKLLAEWNIYPLQTAPQPEYDGLTQTCTEATSAQIDGVWTQQWIVENKPQEEAETNVRNSRNGLLSESDWTQVADAPVDKAMWGTYRQFLRDVTVQEGFPYNVIWPTQPE